VVEDLCFHIVDLVQNAAVAGARRIVVRLRQSAADDTLELSVSDDGRGMDAETVAKVQDPFYTTKGFKRVGLGIPLLKDTARYCHGDFRIDSEPGRGTTIGARLIRSHIDCPPLGDLGSTVVSLMVTLTEVDLVLVCETDDGSFSVSSAEVRTEAGGLALSHPEVLRFLREYVAENLARLKGLAD